MYNGILDEASSLGIPEHDANRFGEQAAHWFSRSVLRAQQLTLSATVADRFAARRVRLMQKTFLGT
jgi:hypothetical protein